jgi:hypothetical protein
MGRDRMGSDAMRCEMKLKYSEMKGIDSIYLLLHDCRTVWRI